jgi:hypothetical protein
MAETLDSQTILEQGAKYTGPWFVSPQSTLANTSKYARAECTSPLAMQSFDGKLTEILESKT